MLDAHPLRRSELVRAILAIAAILAAWILFRRGPDPSEWSASSRAALRQPTGNPQLESVEPLPAGDAPECEWLPASASASLVEALQQNGVALPTASLPSGEARTSNSMDRTPLRVIGDLYDVMTSVAVDPLRNEIVVQGTKLMVYDRLANTPPTATMTEPKRVIAGRKTKLSRHCGLYIDPGNGEIYATATDVTDTLVIFSREARGDVPPDRELATPHRTSAIAVDEENQELFLTVQSPPAVVVYHKNAKGEEAPIRILEGDRTQLADAMGIALDTKRGLMYVSNHGSVSSSNGGWSREPFLHPGSAVARWNMPKERAMRRNMVPSSGRFVAPSITVYPIKASADTPPLRVIQGPKTQLNSQERLYLDSENGELFVANDVDHSILVFRAEDNGDVAPLRVLKGPRTGLMNPSDVYVDTKNDELVVANAGNYSTTVYPRTGSGNLAPLRTIRSAPQGKQSPIIQSPGALDYDTKRDEILVPN